MRNIKILGGGCPNCKKLEAMTRKVATELGIEAEYEKVTDMNKIMEWPVLSTPGLVIDGKLVVSGRIPSETEINGWLKQS